MKGLWKDNEIKMLFDEVEKSKKESQPVRKAFENHAVKFNRKPNSVRNYYYAEIDRLKNDADRLNSLDIDLKLHEKLKRNYFSNEEKNEIITKIKSLVNKGFSVRKACMQLSGGDVTSMLRYQNKFRTCREQKPNNVLKFRKQMQLTEGDLQGLFFGVVKLIRKSIEEQVNLENSNSEKKYQDEIRRLITKVGQKDRELVFYKNDNSRLKTEILSLKKQLMFKNCVVAKKLSAKNMQP